jgi:hypothetical protein
MRMTPSDEPARTMLAAPRRAARVTARSVVSEPFQVETPVVIGIGAAANKPSRAMILPSKRTSLRGG